MTDKPITHQVAPRIEFAVGDLHYEMREPISRLANDLEVAHKAGKTKTLLKPFEGYRSPLRQRGLLSTGATKAGPWKSAHQFGLAVDFAGQTSGRWTWELDRQDIAYLHVVAKTYEVFRVGHISWDPLHIEHLIFARVSLKPPSQARY